MAYHIGIEISSTMFKLAEVTKRGRRMKLHQMVVHPFPPVWAKSGSLFEKEEFIHCVQEALVGRRMRSGPAHVAISGKQVVLKRIRVPEMKRRKYRRFIEEQVLPLLDLPFDDPVFDFELAGHVWFDGDDQEILLALVPREYIDSLVGCLRYCGLDPVHVDLAPLALYRWVDGARGIQAPRTLFLQLTKIEAEISRFVDGVLSDVRVIPLDMVRYLEGEDRPHPDPLKPVLQSETEVGRYGQALLDAVRSGMDEAEWEAWTRSGVEWFLSGEGADLFLLESWLVQNGKIPVKVAPPAELVMSGSLREKASRWVNASLSVPLGLVLTGKEGGIQ
jgi:type IV pilus assembly protein PilM